MIRYLSDWKGLGEVSWKNGKGVLGFDFLNIFMFLCINALDCVYFDY